MTRTLFHRAALTCAALTLAASAQAQILAPQSPSLAFHLGRTTNSPLGRQSTDAQIRWHGATPVLGVFLPVAGVSYSNRGEFWGGAGLSVGLRFGEGSPVFARLSVMPGLYNRGRGADLGGPFHFRSSLELGVETGRNSAIIFMIDHRSNANLRRVNPGMDVISLGWTVALN